MNYIERCPPAPLRAPNNENAFSASQRASKCSLHIAAPPSPMEELAELLFKCYDAEAILPPDLMKDLQALCQRQLLTYAVKKQRHGDDDDDDGVAMNNSGRWLQYYKLIHCHKLSPMRRLAQLLIECCEDSDEQEYVNAGNIPAGAEMVGNLNGVATGIMEDLCKTVGIFLHNKIDIKRHSEDQLRAVITIFPGSLSFHDENGRLPVQSAVYRNRSDEFVPMLAFLGECMEVGGKENRGGLLTPIPGKPSHYNVIMVLANIKCDDVRFCDQLDRKSLRILQRLYAMNLFRRQDVERLNLLTFSCYPNKRLRFSYFVELCQTSLKTTKWQGEPLIHLVLRQCSSIEGFEMVLKAGMEVFPNDLGFLFLKHNGKTAYEVAVQKFGQRDIAACVKKRIFHVNEIRPSVYEVMIAR